jgi:hypothetical protein
VQRVVKALLGYGAKMPKELMLYVKNMVFLDGAIARLAPDLDILAEIASISMMFAERHGERLGRELGIDHTTVQVDLDGVKAGFGLDSSVNQLTYRELQQRRELIQKRMRDHVGPRADPPSRVTFAHVRLVIARCSVDYAGRLSAHLPEASPTHHGQGRRLRGDPRRRRRLQAAQLDERPQHTGRSWRPLGRHNPRARPSRSRCTRCSPTSRTRAR